MGSVPAPVAGRVASDLSIVDTTTVHFREGSVTVRLYARSQQILFPREDGKQAGLIHPSTRIGLSGNSFAIVKAWQSHDCRYPPSN